MNKPHDPNVTADSPSAPADSLRASDPLGTTDHVPDPLGTTDHARGSAGTDGSHPGADVPASDLPAVPGYRVVREIARGGMGKVLAAFDLGLDRDVALKILLPGANADRFVRESKITARLPHPGIPPVHALGTLADGSPFLAMKLIAGRTLAEEMKSADRPRHLQAFTQVCQAVGFAHSRGVIHRDLKPANVMVGAFGEVQVMDWGLAKDLTSRELADELRASEALTAPTVGSDANQTTDHRAPGESTDDRTQAGQVMGTPAYMAPEQARGEASDARSDVFALGGILCAILTGQPPFVGKSTLEVIRRAGAGDLTDALVRLDGCGADAELVALCRRCLSPSRADRPANGQAVADGLTAYLNGVQERLQAAERERAVAVAREGEQRKRRKVQLALAAAVVVLLLGGGAVAWRQSEQAQLMLQREGRNAEAVAALLDQCKEALQAGDAKKAEVVLEAARKRFAEGGAGEQAERLGQLDADLALLRDLDRVDQFRWIWSENKFPDPAVVVARTREALKQFGADPDAVSVDEAAARVSASVVRERIVTALDRVLGHQKKAEVRALLRRVDADPYRDAVRDAVLANDPAKMVELAGKDQAREQPAGFAAFLGDTRDIPVERRRQLLQAALSRRSGDLGLLMTLGNTYLANRKEWLDERLRWYQAAVAAAPANYAAHTNLGGALSGKGQLDEAIACCRTALELDPKNAHAHSNLGGALGAKGQVDEAIACFQNAIELDAKYAAAHAGLGNALQAKGQVDEAIACFQKAIELDAKYANAHVHLGAILCDVKRDYDGAIDCFQKAIELDPKYAMAHTNLGVALASKGQVDAAIPCWRKAIELDPKYAEAQVNLGAALRDKGQVDAAIDCWRKAIELDPKHVRAHCNLGHALASQGRFAESLAAYKRGHELGTKQPGWRYPSAAWVRQAEANAALEAKLPALLKGEFQPSDNKERLGLAGVCQAKKLHHTATGLYVAAFAAEPKLASNLQARLRYNAACSAALAAVGQGEDAAKLDDAAKAKLRGQALDWLKADLAALTKLFGSGSPQARPFIVQTLSHWQKDTDLAGIRDKAALAKLPAEEQRAFARMWADVAALLKKVEEKPK